MSRLTLPVKKKLPLLTQFQLTRLVGKTSQEPWTKDWFHLRDIPPNLKRMLRLNRYKNFVQKYEGIVPLENRIKQWNIIPGDLIRVRGDGDTIREVFGINKFKNLVFVKQSQKEKVPSSSLFGLPTFHYSKCQLYIGDHEYPPPAGETKPTVKQVFALDLRCTAPRWAPRLGRYDWVRFAARTSPPLPGQEYDKARIPIPWPKHEKPQAPAIRDMDTPAEVVKEITWRPTNKFYPASNVGKRRTLENSYLHYIRPLPDGVPFIPYDPETTPPMEYVISDELANKHGGTRKRQRAVALQKERAERKKAFIKAEVANLDGRTKKEATKEAEFKWAVTLRKEMQSQRRKLWIKRGGLARVQHKQARQARKTRQAEDRLRNVVLSPAVNQVIPTIQPTQPSL